MNTTIEKGFRYVKDSFIQPPEPPKRKKKRVPKKVGRDITLFRFFFSVFSGGV